MIVVIHYFTELKREIYFYFHILMEIWIIGSPNFHWYWFNFDWFFVNCPCIPVNASCKESTCVAMNTIKICKATLVEPPSSVITEVTTALYWLSFNTAHWPASIIINIKSAERHGILVIFSSISSKCITYVQEIKQNDKNVIYREMFLTWCTLCKLFLWIY